MRVKTGELECYVKKRMKINIKIRQAEQSDAQALKELDTIVPLDPTRAEFIDRWIKDDIVLVVEVDNSVVGYGVFNHAFFYQGHVDMLMIHKDFRGQGFGEHLLQALEKLCDTSKFYVTTNLSNHRMQKLLTKLSFRSCGYINELDPDDPELVYVKNIKKT